jgi:hypothetical protein
MLVKQIATTESQSRPEFQIQTGTQIKLQRYSFHSEEQAHEEACNDLVTTYLEADMQ